MDFLLHLHTHRPKTSSSCVIPDIFFSIASTFQPSFQRTRSSSNTTCHNNQRKNTMTEQESKRVLLADRFQEYVRFPEGRWRRRQLFPLIIVLSFFYCYYYTYGSHTLEKRFFLLVLVLVCLFLIYPAPLINYQNLQKLSMIVHP